MSCFCGHRCAPPSFVADRLGTERNGKPYPCCSKWDYDGALGVVFMNAVLRQSEQLLFPFDLEKTWAMLSERHRYTRSVRQLMAQPGGIPSEPTQGPIAFLVTEWQQPSGQSAQIWFYPEQWQRHRYIEIRFKLHNMPMSALRVRHELAYEGPTETSVSVVLEGVAAHESLTEVAGKMLNSMFGVHRQATAAVAKRASAGQSPYVDLSPQPEPTQVVQRAQSLLRSAGVTHVASGTIAQLNEYVSLADEVDLRRMRPLELAERFGVSIDTMLPLCLQAARAGVLEIQWDVMCPVCQRPPLRVLRLCELHAQNRCPTCDIEFECDLDTLTEVTFRPATHLRPVTDTVYCTAGPEVAPHVESQVLLEPEEERLLNLRLSPGRYTVRCQRTKLSTTLLVAESGERDALLTATATAFEPAQLVMAQGDITLRIRSLLQEERLFVIERDGGLTGVLTAAQVCASQDFRLLFPREALASGEQVRIRRLTFLFTDLRGSTSFYESLGDGPAYGIVREHFELLTRHIAAHHGAVVKTIGDAVMAVFVDATEALSAALAIQSELPQWNRRRPDIPALMVRVGIHSGPCIAVSANDFLDYFGTTVNMAARIQAQGSGADIVLLRSLADQPSLQSILQGKRVQHFSSTLAGICGTFELTRLDCAADASP